MRLRRGLVVAGSCAALTTAAPATATTPLPPPPHSPQSSYGEHDGTVGCRTAYVRDLDAFARPPGSAPVRRHPARAWLIYLPDSVPQVDASTCHARMVKLGPQSADRLARDIDATRVVTALPPCPSPNGRVQVELDYRAQPQRTAVSVDLGGCHLIWGRSGTKPRWGTQHVLQDIAVVVPRG